MYAGVEARLDGRESELRKGHGARFIIEKKEKEICLCTAFEILKLNDYLIFEKIEKLKNHVLRKKLIYIDRVRQIVFDKCNNFFFEY